MTESTHLFRGNERGEILDADGKVVGRIVPVEPTFEMVLPYFGGDGNVALGHAGAYQECFELLRDAVSAAPADWSAVAVRVPEPVAWRCDWHEWRQYHDDQDPLPGKWDSPAPTVTALVSLDAIKAEFPEAFK